MNVRDYEYIVTIAEQQSITRAAAQLYITQPALTRFLQRTEKVLGLPLFYRKGNQFLLTDFGQQYVKTGRAVMRLDQELTALLDATRAGEMNMIRLGHGMGWTTHILEKILPRFYDTYPDTRINAHAATSQNQMTALQNGLVDIALLTNIPPQSGFISIPIRTSHLALIVPQDSQLMEQAREKVGSPFPVISFEQTLKCPYITISSVTNSGKVVREYLRRKKHSPRVILEVTDVRALFDAVETGLGIALCMTGPMANRRLRCLSLDDTEPLQQTTMLTYRSDLQLTEQMKYLITLLMQEE